MDDKIVFSAIQPTGSLTIGNYIGAVKNWQKLSEQHKCFFSVANMHSITVDLDPATLRKNSLELFAWYVAFGLATENNTLFIQSQVPAHAELTWVLNCCTQFGEAKRMTQFKDKSKKAPENINVGLFDYPVLMAADILLYNADYVPIGKDQQQHLELARVIAERFNSRYSPTFTVPEGIYPKYGAKVYSLTNPAAKMSKSEENPNGYILLSDDKDTVMRKVRRSVTDSGEGIYYNYQEKPGISNLLTIYSAFTGKTMKEAESDFAGKDYAFFKNAVGEAVADGLKPLQDTFSRIIGDKATLETMMRQGAEKAYRASRKILSKVYRKVGFVQID